MAGNLAHSTQNDYRYDDLIKSVKKLGADEANGSVARAKLFVDAVRAAQDGVITTTRHTDGSDDAQRLYSAYAQERAKAAPSEQTKDAIKSKTSDLRKGIEASVIPSIDHTNNIERAYRFRGEMVKAGDKVKSAWQCFADVSRLQIEAGAGSQLSDEQIKSVLGPKPAKDKALEDVLKKIHSDLEKLVTGERKDGLKDQSPEVVAAEEYLRARLAAMLKANEDRAFYAQAASRGLMVQWLPAQVTSH